jgi:hypothetical protein
MGVDTKFRRIKYQIPEGDVPIPVYSGNAFRGKLRRIAALDFLSRIGIESGGDEKVSDKLYYTLFSGGSLQKGSTSTGIDVGLKRELRRMIPFLSVFGTAFVNQMLPGKLGVGIAVPIADETESVTGRPSDRSVWDLVEQVFYTRRDDLEDPQEKRGDDDTAQQMRYTIECLSTGTELVHEFLLHHPTDIDLACFGAVIRNFEEDPMLGGKSGVGHGKVRLAYEPAWPDPQPYYEYMDAHRDEIVAYVRGMEEKLSGGAKEKKEKKERAA